MTEGSLMHAFKVTEVIMLEQRHESLTTVARDHCFLARYTMIFLDPTARRVCSLTGCADSLTCQIQLIPRHNLTDQSGLNVLSS